ncbi:MAG TPA: polysaccharide biosynthesis/export family protein [Verrucomicrobiae bacterium]|nr:polysaccharide biosynthesis/export family protein [Verrucomicrobiae bacterium]
MLAVFVAFAVGAQTASTPLQLPSPLPSVSTPLSTPATQPAAAAAAGARTPSPGLLNGYVPDDTYKLRVGDTVSFQIMEDQIWDPQNAPKNLVVQDSGEIEVPYIGRVMAVGKTCNNLAEEIKAALEKDYYKHATVVISMNVASPILGRVYIWGQVQHQGPLDIQINENLTAGQAILRAGGFADFANQRKVKVIRSSTGPDKSKQTETINLDMEQILSEGKTDQDIVLQPGDLIIVPAKLLNF